MTVVVTDPAKRGVDGTVERAGEALAHRLLLNTDLLRHLFGLAVAGSAGHAAQQLVAGKLEVLVRVRVCR